MSNILNYMPGMKSNKKWKKVVAIIYYVLCVFYISQGLGSFLIIATMPFIVFGIRDLVKSSNKKRAVITVLISVILFSAGYGIEAPKKAATDKAQALQYTKNLEAKEAKDASDKIATDKQAVIDQQAADAKAKIDAEQAANKAKADADANAKAQEQATAGQMTLAKFTEIKNGMSYAQVTAIMGGEGAMSSEVGSPGDPYYTVAYTYTGIGYLGANAILMFQGGKLNTKSQMGCK